jgi:O-antigen ligase
LAETGILGFIPYVTVQVLLVSAFWTLRKRDTRDSRLAWTFFLYIFLSYWINGMTLACGYDSDLNLWLVLAISVIYKYAISERALPGSIASRTRLIPVAESAELVY